MIENNTQLAAALFQMESFADTLEGMRRHAQQAEPSVFAVTSGGFINLLRGRITEIKVYVDALPEAPPQERQQRLHRRTRRAKAPARNRVLTAVRAGLVPAPRSSSPACI